VDKINNIMSKIDNIMVEQLKLAALENYIYFLGRIAEWVNISNGLKLYRLLSVWAIVYIIINVKSAQDFHRFSKHYATGLFWKIIDTNPPPPL